MPPLLGGGKRSKKNKKFHAIVSFHGNTQSKSRLYSILISNHLDFFDDKFQVLGDDGDDIEKFQAFKEKERTS